MSRTPPLSPSSPARIRDVARDIAALNDRVAMLSSVILQNQPVCIPNVSPKPSDRFGLDVRSHGSLSLSGASGDDARLSFDRSIDSSVDANQSRSNRSKWMTEECSPPVSRGDGDGDGDGGSVPPRDDVDPLYADRLLSKSMNAAWIAPSTFITLPL